MGSKIKISSCFINALKIWGSAWLSFWIAMPLILIWRGTNDSSPELALTVEYAIISVCGLLFGFLLLTLFIGLRIGGFSGMLLLPVLVVVVITYYKKQIEE